MYNIINVDIDIAAVGYHFYKRGGITSSSRELFCFSKRSGSTGSPCL